MVMPATPDRTTPLDAGRAGLRYVSDDEPGLRRVTRGKGFAYLDAKGRAVRDHDTRARVRRLAIPPAWTDVWISADPDGHLQATGRDARGRKQYRYHPDFTRARDETKYHRLLEFARALPEIRRRVALDMGRRGLPYEKVVATVVHLLDSTLIRVGNTDYARRNGSFGLTTLRDRHVKVEGGALRFAFTGKSGKMWQLKVSDRRVARIVKSCQDLPGQHLFQYLDEDGERRAVGSADVNAWLRDVSGREITAKDFRTWAGTVLAALALSEFEAVDRAVTAKANVREAIERVARRLGNTPTICRKCYVHPEILDGYLDGALALDIERRAAAELNGDLGHFRTEEVAVLAFLKRRLRRQAAAERSPRKTRRRARPEAIRPSARAA
jgi:DNA topoisomerase-1